MEPPPSAEKLVEEVDRRIDRALAANRVREWFVVATILVLLTVGVGLVVYAAYLQNWTLLASGGLVQLLLIVPLDGLIKLREDAMRLQIVPQLLRLADTEEGKRLAAKFVDRLIEQV